MKSGKGLSNFLKEATPKTPNKKRFKQYARIFFLAWNSEEDEEASEKLFQFYKYYRFRASEPELYKLIRKAGLTFDQWYQRLDEETQKDFLGRLNH